MQGLSDAVEDRVQKLEEKRLNDEIEKNKEFFISFGASAFSSAMIYTNLIILAGYAGIFSVWGFTKDILPNYTVVFVAILMIISLFVFISFETYKMVSNSLVAFKLGEFIKPDMSPSQTSEAIQQYQKVLERNQVMILRIWPLTLFVTICTGYGAGLILLSHLVCSLFN